MRTVDESITQEEKRSFYSSEIGKIFKDVVEKDVEWSSLRLEDNQLISTH